MYKITDIIFDGKYFRTADGLFLAQRDLLGAWTWQKAVKSSIKVPAYESYMEGMFFSHQEGLEKLNEYLQKIGG